MYRFDSVEDYSEWSSIFHSIDPLLLVRLLRRILISSCPKLR